uniref:Uncharacterized protein n=1 Tax=Romanomermis culicivorax TaxID=13658 RepID=A0A915KHR7_ROMCU
MDFALNLVFSNYQTKGLDFGEIFPILKQEVADFKLLVDSSFLFSYFSKTNHMIAFYADKVWSSAIWVYKNYMVKMCKTLTEGVFDRGQFNGCGHFTEKNYLGCKQRNFQDFLMEGVFGCGNSTDVVALHKKCALCKQTDLITFDSAKG